jgi:hypothetical protein
MISRSTSRKRGLSPSRSASWSRQSTASATALGLLGGQPGTEVIQVVRVQVRLLELADEEPGQGHLGHGVAAAVVLAERQVAAADVQPVAAVRHPAEVAAAVPADHQAAEHEPAADDVGGGHLLVAAEPGLDPLEQVAVDERLMALGPDQPRFGRVLPRGLLVAGHRAQAALAVTVPLPLGVEAPGPVADVAAVSEQPQDHGAGPAPLAPRAVHGEAAQLLTDHHERVAAVVQADDEPDHLGPLPVRHQTPDPQRVRLPG